MFTVHVDMPGADAILAKHGLEDGGYVQRMFAESVMRHADKYVPFDQGILAASARVEDGGNALSYNTPYARYLWFGKLMVDPITGKGAFHDEESGRFWSRPKTPKVLSARSLNYQGAPLRGPMWVQRMWINEGAEICREMEALINGGG